METLKKKILLCCLSVVVVSVIFLTPSFGDAERTVFNSISVNSAITPAIADYIIKNIRASREEGIAGIIILLDTPGGLDLSMRDIVKEILNAPLPVIVFVYPSGARAASAGVMITMAAHVAAMAPGTNIGAAHPVAMGAGGKMDETMAKKVENDAVAYAKSIAKKRNRDVVWVEDAVRKSVSITAEEAVKEQVVDVLATDVKQLLKKIDGKIVSLPAGQVTLNTKNATVNAKRMGIRDKILTTLSNPNIAYLLLMIGLAGLYFEFANPGAILPGVIGGISLILSFFALQTLPVNYAGILLIVFGIILFVAEIKIVSHGMLTVAGVIALVLGSILLFESPSPALKVSLRVMIPTVVIISIFFVAVIALAVKAQMKQPRTGREGMIGLEGRAVTFVKAEGKVFIKGEYWDASSQEGIEEGDFVKVIDIKGLSLVVEKIKKP